MVHFAGRKQYNEAIGMLLHAITSPAMIISAITIAALKKFILLCLIQKGDASVLLDCLACIPML